MEGSWVLSEGVCIFLRVGALGVDSAVFPVVPPSRMSIFGDCGLGFESIVLSKCQRFG